MRHVLWALAVVAGMSLAAPASAAVAFEQGMVSITIDDGWSTQWTYARGMLNQRGIKSTYYIVTDAVKDNWVGFLTLPQLRTLATDGNEIASHTLDHPDLTTVSDAELTQQVTSSKSWLLANLGSVGVSSVPDFASPYGRYDARVLGALRPVYTSNRTVLNQHNFKDGAPYELGAYDCHSGITVPQVKSWIDQAVAQKTWLILLFHEFTPGVPTRSTQIRNSDFTAILDYLAPVKKVTVAQGRALMQAGAPPPPPPPPPPAVSGLPVYHEALESGFENWSWATNSLSQTTVVHSGARGIHFEPDGWAGLYFHHSSLINTASYSGLDFWIHGGTSGNQDVEVRLFNGDQEVGSAEISELLGAPIAAGQWRHVVMPFSSLGISGSFNDIFFQDASGQNQARVYLDDIQLAPK